MRKLLAVCFTKNMEESVRFYQTLGMDLNHDIDPGWTALDASGGTWAVHSHQASTRPKAGFEVSFVAESPLETIQSGLVATGYLVNQP